MPPHLIDAGEHMFDAGSGFGDPLIATLLALR
ncbi:MAG: hypothetical protein ACJAVI_003531 [Candidatus Azotimanducaceae bacterium]|jgi:hypothetical protein